MSSKSIEYAKDCKFATVTANGPAILTRYHYGVRVYKNVHYPNQHPAGGEEGLGRWGKQYRKMVVTVTKLQFPGDPDIYQASCHGYGEGVKWVGSPTMFEIVKEFVGKNGFQICGIIDHNEGASFAPITHFKWHLSNDWGISKSLLKANFEDNFRDENFDEDRKLIYRRGQLYTLPEVCKLLGWLTTSSDDCKLDNPEDYHPLAVLNAKKKRENEEKITHHVRSAIKATGLFLHEIEEMPR